MFLKKSKKYSHKLTHFICIAVAFIIVSMFSSSPALILLSTMYFNYAEVSSLLKSQPLEEILQSAPQPHSHMPISLMCLLITFTKVSLASAFPALT